MVDDKDDNTNNEEEENIFADDNLDLNATEGNKPDDDDLDDLFGGEDDEDDDEGGFGDFKKSSDSTLADLWRNNPIFKIGVVFVGIAALFILIAIITSSEEEAGTSYVPTGSDVTSAPGSTDATPAFVEAVKEANQAEVERAIREGDSALPVPIETPVGRLELPDTSTDEDQDPLERWRQLQRERLERELAEQKELEGEYSEFQNAGDEDGSARDYTEDIAALADVMSQQMQSILENRSEVLISYLSVTPKDYLERQEIEEAERAQRLAEARKAAVDAGGIVRDADGNVVAAPEEEPDEEAEEIIYPAGNIAYAQLITEANSDAPGPVLAQIMAGPLKGSRVIGSFEVQKELLTLTFNTIVVDGISYPADAVALDPDTTLAGMATEVDHRYLKRVILPAAAAFVEGAAEAIANSGITTVTVEGDTVTESESDRSNEQEISAGVEEAGREIGEIMDEIANDTEVLVRIESGTPMGILFLEPVTK